MGVLDLRGLAPPEPLEHIVDHVDGCGPGQTFGVLLPHEPFPLYPLLEQRGCTWEGHATDGGFLLTITTGP